MKRTSQHHDQLALSMADMARELVDQDVMQPTLSSIVNHAVRLVDGCDAAGILKISKDEIATLAGAGPALVTEIAERIQTHAQRGPWFDVTVRGMRMYRIEDTYAAHIRWPDFAERARTLGVGSVMGFVLFVEGEHDLDGLELYAGARGAFSDCSEHTGLVLALYATAAVANARHRATMTAALGSAHTLGEATGIVMSRYSLDEQAAFETIRRTSRQYSTRIHDLAEKITATGELPP